MKMQHEVQAGIDGIVVSICREVGTQVAAGDLILQLEPAAPAAAGAADKET
jgi:biotin carboxyl carrier protein